MCRVKIYGAGSIGNHFAHACRVLGWDVVVCDVSGAALERMKCSIYPQRYGQWDATIQLCDNSTAPVGGFDLIVVGTPPDTHLPLAIEALRETPKALLIEKPLCTPDLEHAPEFHEAARQAATKVFVGYDHVLGKAARLAEDVIRSGVLGEVETLDVEFREHWAGIFQAHAWLTGPDDSYLGFWQRGGGASGEHSHAVNLWQHFAHLVGAGRVIEVDAMVRYVTKGRGTYDDLCAMHLRTERGLIGRVVQDVVTLPARKWARMQGSRGAVEWVNGYNSEGDAVLVHRPDAREEVHVIPKKRPDDFIEELRHIDACVTAAAEDSGIRLERGLDTMLVLAAAHRSEPTKRRVAIDYGRGHTLEALQS